MDNDDQNNASRHIQMHTAKLPWRSEDERDDWPKILSEKEIQTFLCECHDARLKILQQPKEKRNMNEYWALYGATVALHYVLNNIIYSDYQIKKFVHFVDKLEPIICPDCERPMERITNFSGLSREWKCPECGKREYVMNECGGGYLK